MISLDSVITLTSGFVTLDKLKPHQYIKGEDSSIWLGTIEYGMMKAVLVVTKSFDIICSYGQMFVVNNTLTPAWDIQAEDKVLTSEGEEEVIRAVRLPDYVEMGGLNLKSGRFLANGFVLMAENYG